MRWTVAVLLVSVAFAGCADTNIEPVQDESAFEDIEVEASATTGIIRGVVVDETITPLPDVKVTIQALGLETTTNFEGAFGFGDLEPGLHWVKTERLGYESVQQSVEVVAGEDKPPIVRLLMTSDPSQLPFVVPLKWDGHMMCGLSVIALCGVIDIVYDTPDEFMTIMDVENANVTYLQSDMVWRTTTGASPNMQLWQEVSGSCTLDVQNAPSPNIINTTHGDYGTHGSKECFDSLGPDHPLRLRVFAGSIDGTFPPTQNGCYPVVGLCMGIGFTIEQPFEVFNHLFYGYKPYDGWNFVEAGEPPAPPS